MVTKKIESKKFGLFSHTEEIIEKDPKID